MSSNLSLDWKIANSILHAVSPIEFIDPRAIDNNNVSRRQTVYLILNHIGYNVKDMMTMFGQTQRTVQHGLCQALSLYESNDDYAANVLMILSSLAAEHILGGK